MQHAALAPHIHVDACLCLRILYTEARLFPLYAPTSRTPTVKVGVQQQDAVGQDGLHVQQHRLRGAVEVVGCELGLDHDLGWAG